MSELERYALSFGSVAEAYEAYRPEYADDAVDWIAGRLPLRDVLDLAAGTGKLTRQLVARGARVVAVEPDPEMRAVFADVLPSVPVHDGRGEAIPLADGSVDVVTVGQAFHWFDARAAYEEMHRVVRGGGGIALLWNLWSEDDPVLSRLNELLDGSRRVGAPSWREEDRDGLFGEFDRREFTQTRRLTLEQIEGWASSTSAVVNAAPEEQEQIVEQIRAIVAAPAVDVAIGTRVLVADRA